VASQLIEHKIETRNVLEVASVTSEQPERVLNGLTGQPQVLHAIAMLSARGSYLRSKSTEDFAGTSVDWQKWSAQQSAQSRKASLPDCTVGRHFDTEP